MSQEDLIKGEATVDDYTEKGLVVCKYCLKPFKHITPTHLRTHNMTVDDYKEKFPGAPMACRPEALIKPNKDEITIPESNVEWNMDSPLTKNNAYLLLKEKYPNIQKNYIFKKFNKEGHILFTFHVDFADPYRRILFDFEEMSWHAFTPLFTKYRKKDLAGQSKWKYINFEQEFQTMEEFKKYLNKK